MKTETEKCLKCGGEHEWSYIFSFSKEKLAKQVLLACCSTCSAKINNMMVDQWSDEIKTLGNRLKKVN